MDDYVWGATPNRRNGEEFDRRMKAIAESGDTEGAHAEADALMVSLLRAFGYGKAMDIYEAMPKWYA